MTTAGNDSGQIRESAAEEFHFNSCLAQACSTVATSTASLWGLAETGMQSIDLPPLTQAAGL